MELTIQPQYRVNLSLSGEDTLNPLPAAQPHLASLLRSPQQSADRMGEGDVVVRLDEQASFSVKDNILQGANPCGDHRFTDRHGLEHRSTRPLGSRCQEDKHV
jgi:hypothetical protein